MNKRKVCVVTGTRAEYGLLYWLLKGISADKQLDLQLCVTGMHLSPEFGLTYQQIEKDGFKIDKKIEILLSSDSSVSITKSIGLAQISFAEAFDELKPDVLLIVGDRYEIFAVASAAMICRIPIAHCHGGETTEGAIDEAIRHAITKMSHLHFPATQTYAQRIIQLGEHPDRVFNVGGLGIENINKLNLLSKEALENSIDFNFLNRNLLVTFHPATLANISSKDQMEALLSTLTPLKDVGIIFTLPNSDADSRVIIQLIREFADKHPQNTTVHQSLGQLRYLSTLQFVDGVVGNSSSGLIEVPSFRKGTINIGDRQKGRIMADSVINCLPNTLSIQKAIQELYSSEFQSKLPQITNPYGEGNSSEKIIAVLKSIDLSNILKKSFYNLDLSHTLQ